MGDVWCFLSNQVSSSEHNMLEDGFETLEYPTPPPKKQTADLIKELKNVVPHAEDLHRYVEQVEQDYVQKMNGEDENFNNLLEAFTSVLKERPPAKQKDKTHFWTKTKMKVFSVVAAETFGADLQILDKVDAEVCYNPADCDVVLVFCPVTSRVGSDVEDAMRNIPDGARGKRTILVVMHHSRKDVPSSETRLNHGHENVIQDLHMVYHETKKGLIKCNRNDDAIHILKEWGKALTT